MLLKIQSTYVRCFWGNRKLTFFKEGFFNCMKIKKEKDKRKVKGIYFVFQENLVFDESANNLATRVSQFKPTRTVGEEGTTSMQHLSMISGVLGIDVIVDLREVNVTS